MTADKPFTLTRRGLTTALLAAPAVLAAGRTLASSGPLVPSPDVETRSLDELHQAALAEGGQLVVYSGGDLPNAYAGWENMFRERFPGVEIRIFADLSKYHDARIDLQFERGRLEADVAILQTLHDFDRWKTEGKLLPYKPLDWDVLYPETRDPDGAFHSIGFFAFSNNLNADLIDPATAPRDAIDYLNPALRGQIALTYPHDDDAVLYQFERIVAQHGWDYMDQLMAQDVLWMRGTVPTRVAVQRGERAVSFTNSGALNAPANSPLRFQLPVNDSFLSWPQTAGILSEAPHKEAAKLFLSWMASLEATRARTGQWSARRDFAGAEGWEPVFAYNTAPEQFRAFMQDRARVERLKTQFEHIIGPVVGPNPTELSGVYLLEA